jgi:hypothetical protein
MNGVYSRDGIVELRRLTQEYASFSRSRAGLGNALGGVVGLVVFGVIWLFGGNTVTAALAIMLTLLWLVGKEVIRRRFYQGFGAARETWTGSPRRTHQWSVLLFTPLLLALAVWIVAAGWLSKPAVAWPYLIFCLATPVIMWRSLYTLNEIMIGFGLLFMCAITASGHTPALLGLLIVPAYAAAMIPLGLAEHRQFQALETRLHARRGTPA